MARYGTNLHYITRDGLTAAQDIRLLTRQMGTYTPPPAPAPPPPPAPAPVYTPPPQPQQQNYSPPPAPSVATASSVNETREAAKASTGKASTLLSEYGGMTRARKSSTEAEARSKLGLTETTKRSLLGSA